MNIAKRLLRYLFFAVVAILILFIAMMSFYPEKTSDFIGYRFYTVLTNSMEPRIPTYSIVISKMVGSDEELHLKKGDVITFDANRFGEEILVTHHFNKTEKTFKGETIYRTNAEGTTQLDMYETHREDIIGTYVFHIPYIGKVILFLQSKFGLLMYAELIVIWLINKLITTRWKEKEQAQQRLLEEQAKTNVPQDIRSNQDCYDLEADLCNHTGMDIHNIFVEIALFDETQRMQKRYIIRVSRKITIPDETIHTFRFRFTCDVDLTSCELKLLSYDGKDGHCTLQ